MFRSLVVTIAYLLDRTDMWSNASVDALMDTPVPKAVKRSRRLSEPFRRALGEAIAKRLGGTTPGKVVSTLQRYRRWGPSKFMIKPATNALRGRVRSYIRECKTIFSTDRCRHISYACDGTRMGQKDIMYSSLFAPELNRAAWLPPQVICGTPLAEFSHKT